MKWEVHMKKIRLLALIACALGFAPAIFAGETAKLVKTRSASGDAVVPGKWHVNYSKCLSYAKQKGVPLIAVWSNGDSCGHCVTFESACNSSAFKTWMKSSGCVFLFVHSGDSGGGRGGSTYSFCYNGQSTFPLVRVYWYVNGKKKVNVYTIGDTVDGSFSGSTGGKKAVAWFKKKLSAFKPATAKAAAAVKPYTIEFEPNGATNEMAAVSTKVGATLTLPACTLVRPDYSFSGWAKTADGAVAYKNKASVKNLTTVSNGVVTLYAKWTRTTYRTYYTGIKCTISMGLKNWTTSSKVAGLKWNKSTGKWTGTPTKAGVFTVKFKKGSSSATRKIVVLKDSVLFADESVTQRVVGEGEPLTLDLSPSSQAGEVKSVSVTGLPDGLAYAGGVISGTPRKVGTFKITVTAVSANGQKLTRSFQLVIGVPDCCIGVFNGFVGSVDSNRLDVLDLVNRGTVRISAPSNANLSAKVVTAKGTYAMTGLGWTYNGDGTYTAHLATADGKSTLSIAVDSAAREKSFYEIGVFLPSYATAYDVWVQRSPFKRDASGAYIDPMAASTMPRVAGKWYFKASAVSGGWLLGYVAQKKADVTLSVVADGTATLAGKIGSNKISASSSVFLFDSDVASGFVRSEFAIPVTVSKVKKTLNVWLKLWFDRSSAHALKPDEGIGAAELESFK